MSEEIQEVWKELENYTSYLISNTGKIKNKVTGELRPQTINGGFWCSNLVRDDGVKELSKVHRLVAMIFVPNPEGSYFVGQYGDKLDASASNQYWKVKRVKPEPVVKEVTFVDYLGEALPLEEFVKLCPADKKTTKLRLRNGWTTLECVLGWLAYEGDGYTDDSHWYPTAREYYKAQTVKRYLWLEEQRKQRALEKKNNDDKYNKKRLEYRNMVLVILLTTLYPVLSIGLLQTVIEYGMPCYQDAIIQLENVMPDTELGE